MATTKVPILKNGDDKIHHNASSKMVPHAAVGQITTCTDPQSWVVSRFGGINTQGLIQLGFVIRAIVENQYQLAKPCSRQNNYLLYGQTVLNCNPVSWVFLCEHCCKSCNLTFKCLEASYAFYFHCQKLIYYWN